MQEHSQEFQKLLKNVEVALVKAGQNARKLAEQTGTELIIRECEICTVPPQESGEAVTTDRAAE